MGHHHGHGHGHADGHDGTRSAAVITLLVNIALVVLKWTAYAFTGSPSLFAEAAHSSADTLNPVLLWFGYRRSKRPADVRHPLGHGRAGFFWSLMAALMMLCIGSFVTAAHGIRSLVSGESPEISMVAAAIMAIALIGEGYSVIVTIRGIRSLRNEGHGADKNPVLLALLIENGADMLGVTLAACGYGLYLLTGNPMWDGVFSLCIAGLLAISSGYLIRRNLSLITGEAATETVRDRIADAAASAEHVRAVIDVLAVMSGVDSVNCRVFVLLEPPSSHMTAKHADTPWATAEAVIREGDRMRKNARLAITKTVHERVPQVDDVIVVFV